MNEIREYILSKELESRRKDEIIGALAHIASNAATKAAYNTEKGRRIASSIFRKGIQHAKEGKRLRGGVEGALNAGLGPEAHHIYQMGKDSTRPQRLAANLIKKVTDKKTTTHKLADIMTGRESKIVKDISNKIPKKVKEVASKITTTKKPKDKFSKASEAFGMAAATAVAPEAGIINSARTLLSKTKLGKKVLKDTAKKARSSGKSMSGIKRVVSDYVGSPSIGIASDLGKESRKISKFKKAGKSIKNAVTRSKKKISDKIKDQANKLGKLGKSRDVSKITKVLNTDKEAQKNAFRLVKSVSDSPKVKVKIYKQLRKSGVPKEDIHKYYNKYKDHIKKS